MWIIKGQLVPDGYSERDYVEVHDSYFKRIWGNHEAPTHEDGFEEAFNILSCTTAIVQKFRFRGRDDWTKYHCCLKLMVQMDKLPG